jgi:hypothetical protein
MHIEPHRGISGHKFLFQFLEGTRPAAVSTSTSIHTLRSYAVAEFILG